MVNIKAWLWIALAVVLGVTSIFFVDLPVSRFCVEHPDWGTWKELRRWIMLCEFFGYGASPVIVWWMIFRMDPARRSRMGVVALVFILCGVAPNLIKAGISRYRPAFFFTKIESNAEIGDVTVTETGADCASGIRRAATGLDAFTMSPVPAVSRNARGSFPSGHSATAWGCTLVLMVFYPRGRNIFIFFAVMVMVQRVVCGAHFVSDTLIGAALAGAIVMLLVSVLRGPGSSQNPGHENAGSDIHHFRRR